MNRLCIRTTAFAWLTVGLMVMPAVVSGARADPTSWKAEGWSKTDFTKHAVPFKDILSGGVPRDGIPSIDKPKFIPIAEETELSATEPVIGLVIDGDARAYPLRILTWHEIVNDVVGGRPVAVTYCPLCNAAIVFDRLMDGKTLEFGTTGKLRNSDLIMYDRQTFSWWQQFTGEGIVGVMTGKALKMLPARLESFARFKARHPKGKVLIPNNPGMRPYGRNPYPGYDSLDQPFLFTGEFPKGIEPMARVVVVEVNGKPQAIALDVLRKKGRMTLGELELSWSKGQASALDSPTLAEGRDVGNVVVTKPGKDGKRADARYDLTFAFVFHAFHPQAAILKK